MTVERVMPDLHAERPLAGVPVRRVGHRGVKRPMVIAEYAAPALVTVDVAVGLTVDQRGAHMSRLIDCLDPAARPATLTDYVRTSFEELRTVTAGSAGWELDARAVTLLPVDGGVKPIEEICSIQQLAGMPAQTTWGVALKVALACPQAQAVIAADRLAGDHEIGDHPSHNQVCDLEVAISGVPDGNWGLTTTSLVLLAEQAASGPVRERHKRRSEADAVASIHARACFAEDALRNLCAQLRLLCPDATAVRCEIVNYESIFEYPLHCVVVH